MSPTINEIITQKDFMVQIAIPLAAFAVSFFALFVSIGAIFFQHKHNKKSVRPVGHIELWDSLQGLQVKIVNRGCGPMLIKEFIAENKSKQEKNIVYHLPRNILTGITHQTHTEPKGYWLLPGDELVLLKINGDEDDIIFVEIRERVRSIICDLNTTLRFCDIYDKEHPKYKKSLDWFSKVL